MENVVTVIFEVESEAYQAFTEIRNKPYGAGYIVAEASLLKRRGDEIIVDGGFDSAGITSDDTETGLIIGSIVGLLGGPLGVLLGAGAGAVVGGTLDAVDAGDSASMLEVTAAKLIDGEVAIVALVQEEEPAFDAAFGGYETTIIRQFAVDVAEEVDLARKAAVDFEHQLRGELRAERKAERAEKREERKAKINAKFDEIDAKRAEHKARFEEGKEIARESISATNKEMFGKE